MLRYTHMEPSTTPDYSGSTEVKTVTKSNLLMICDPLCRPSSVSKILAAVLFIILPFIGAYVGYQMSTDVTSNVSSSITLDSKIDSDPLEDEKTVQEPSGLVLQNYSGAIGQKGFPGAFALSEIGKSNDGTKTYFTRLAYEGYGYTQLLYSENFTYPESSPIKDNGLGLYTVDSSLFINPVQKNQYYSATSASYWLLSPDNTKLAVVSPDENSPMWCQGPEMGDPIGVDSVVNVIELNTAKAYALKAELRNPFIAYQILAWKDENTLEVVKRTYDSVTSAEFKQKTGYSCGDFKNQKLAGQIINEEQGTLSLTSDFEIKE